MIDLYISAGLLIWLEEYIGYRSKVSVGYDREKGIVLQVCGSGPSGRGLIYYQMPLDENFSIDLFYKKTKNLFGKHLGEEEEK